MGRHVHRRAAGLRVPRQGVRHRHESCRRENIDCCMGCGLCGYVCPARRPVLQYIRLAQAKLQEIDRNRQLVEITPVSHERDAGKAAQQ